jgi:NADH-quinone oxidoreductase subunit E
MSITFSKESLEIIDNMIKRYPEGKHKSALIPVLHIAQAEFGGWLSTETMDYVASVLQLKPIEVYEVASFYSMFNLKPVGKCVLEVCHTGPCAINGGEALVEYLSKKLNIKVGETTADGVFTLKAVECLGSCGTAPMLQCGAKYFENLTNEKTDELLDNLKKENRQYSYTDLI